MSEETKAKPTPGPWHTSHCFTVWGESGVRGAGHLAIVANTCSGAADGSDWANAALIAAAGTAASECEALGYDGTAAVRALPALLRALDGVAADLHEHGLRECERVLRAALDAARWQA